MEQKIAALFSSVRNALDSQTYTYSDSDYLVSKILVEFLEGENALVASARQIPDPKDVVESVINYVISTEYASADPDVWYSKAASIVVDFADFAYKNEISENSAKFAALLPDGHPRVYRVHPLTASAHREALAAWMAADPRLDEDAAEAVYSLYSQEDFEDVEAEYKNMKLEALAASGRVPEDVLPLVAAFNMSRAMRSAISKALAAIRRRDRKGRFAEEFGRLKLIFGFGGGKGSSGGRSFFSKSPRTVGPGRGSNSYIVEFDDSDSRIPEGLYEVDAAKGENVKAYLPKSAVKGLKSGKEVVSEEDKKYAIDLDQMLATKMDAPLNWEKSGKGFKTKDGKLTATPISSDEAEKYLGRARERGDDVILSGTGAGDDFDPENPKAFLVADNKGRAKGIAQDWAGIQEIAIVNGADLGEGSERITPENLERFIDQDDRIIFRDEPTEKLSKESLSPDMLGEGYNFDKNSETEWSAEDPEGGILRLSKFTDKDGKDRWELTREYGDYDGSGQGLKTESLGDFDDKVEAFEFTADRAGKDWDQEWVDELLAEQDGPDLDQSVPEIDNRTKVDTSKISPEMREKYAETFDKFDEAIFNNDRRRLAQMLEKASLDLDMPDDVYSALYEADDWRANRNSMVENAIERGSRGDVDDMLNDPEFSGWHDRLQDAMDEFGPEPDDSDRFPNYDLDQDAPILSEKQMEPATGKQYALLKELADERQMDPATEQAFADALENKNLNKAQAGALINSMRNAEFKEGVDPNKPSQRMLDSLQGYLATKDLTPSEIKSTLDSVEADPSRANVDALLNKLRRKKDKPVDLNQGVGSLIKYDDDNYQWEDVYNSVSVQNGKNGWEVDYTNPDLDDRGGQVWQNRRFNSEEEALAFAEELIKQNQDDSGFGRAAEDMRGIGSTDADLDQDARGTLEDPATDKQWDFLESLLNGKKIDDPQLEAAVRSALNDRNLTKGEVGAFIGQLRPLQDRPDARREPTAKQIASIRRAALERDLSPEEKKELQDKLDAGPSFDEASELLNDLKSRPITAEGMNDLLDNMLGNQDLDGLKYLLSKPEYAEFEDAIRDTIQTLRRDQGTDQDFDPDLDIDLNQDSGDVDSYDNMDPEPKRELDMAIDRARSGFDRAKERLDQDLFDEEITQDEYDEAVERLDDELDAFISMAKDRDYSNLGFFESGGSEGISDVSEAAEDVLEAWLIQGNIDDARRREEDDVDLDQDVSGSKPDYSLESITDELSKEGFDPTPGMEDGFEIELDNGDLVSVGNQISDPDDGPVTVVSYVVVTTPDGREFVLEEFDEPNAWSPQIVKDALDRHYASQSGPDLDQNAGRSISRDDIVDSLADELDKGYENGDYFVNGDELQTYVDEFDSTTNPDTAGEMAAAVYDMSNSVTEPELKKRLRDLSERLDEEMVDRFGISEAARYGDGRDSGIDLDDASEKINLEREMYFETRVPKIIELLDEDDVYGDNRSKGAEARISENEDGTYTATVGYDRESEEQTFEDRAEATEWAANRVADYNEDVIPASYVDSSNTAGEGDVDLELSARTFQNEADAKNFADELEELADDLDNHRGDPRLATSLREYAERINDLIAKRQRDNESQAPDEPTTPETMDEMATDPELNPEGYAQSVVDELTAEINDRANSSGGGGFGPTFDTPGEGEYVSGDGRVKAYVNYDGETDSDGPVDLSSLTIEVDGEEVYSGRLFDVDDMLDNIAVSVKDHFSKKA